VGVLIEHFGTSYVMLSLIDLKKSRAFYEEIGFHVFAGEESHGYLMMYASCLSVLNLKE
jgi:hypothetical protein